MTFIIEFPVYVSLFGSLIHIHIITDLLAYPVAYIAYKIYCKKRPDVFDKNQRYWLLVTAAIGALIGARLLASTEDPGLFLNPPNLMYYLLSGKTILGAIAGGIISIEIYKKIKGIKKASGDHFVFPLIFGISFGRIGCFLTGVSDRTVGVESNLNWAMDQGDGVLRHPTSLYEILFLLLLGLALFIIEKKIKLKNGSLFKIFAFSYFSFRFLVEFIKPIDPLLLGLTGIQLVSLFFIIYYIYFFLNRKSNV